MEYGSGENSVCCVSKICFILLVHRIQYESSIGAVEETLIRDACCGVVG